MSSEESLTLADLMLHAEQFCAQCDVLGSRVRDRDERAELRLKLSQCRGFLSLLQNSYDEGELRLSNPAVRANFRQLIIALLWVSFRVRQQLDFKLFRRVVIIEAGFTLLLAARK